MNPKKNKRERTKREKGREERKGTDRLKHLQEPKTKMKKLGKLLNYQSRLLQEKKKKELRTLKKHPKQMFKGSKIRTLKTILILGRISKSLPLVNSKMLEETTQMISISEEM